MSAYLYCATPRGPEEHLRDGESCQICKDWMKKVGARIVKGKVIAPKPKVEPLITKKPKAKDKRENPPRNPYNLELEPCGTPAAALRHLRKGEEMCAPCRDARNAYAREKNAARRRRLGIKERPRVTEREHGTMTGFRQHRKHGETPCDPCRDAKNAYGRIVGQRARDKKKALRDAA